jgi:hypothetical protein
MESMDQDLQAWDASATSADRRKMRGFGEILSSLKAGKDEFKLCRSKMEKMLQLFNKYNSFIGE